MMLRFPHKQLRAQVIADYLRECGRYEAGVVCFTCGNAAAALRAAGLYVVEVGPRGGLQAGRWWQPAQIARAWPTLFDATSGHLPLHLMAQVGAAYRGHLGPLAAAVEVPSGSGEGAVCLAMAYPATAFTAVFDDGEPATTYSDGAPLLPLVRKLCTVRRTARAA